MDSKNSPHERRAHARVSIPATAIIDGSKYKVKNWSIGGMKLSGFNQPTKVGDCLSTRFCLRADGGTRIEIDTLIEILWFSSLQGKLGVRFLNLTQLERNLLQNSIDNFQRGEITFIEESSEQSEPPLQLVPRNLRTNKARHLIPITLSKKVLLTTLAYVGVGGLLGGFAISTIYQSANTMDIRSAMIAEQVEPVLSTSQGLLSSVHVREGMTVQTGQLLFQVSNQEAIQQEINDINALMRNKIDNLDELKQKVEFSRVELAETEVGLQRIKSLKRKEIDKLKSYGAIAQSKLESARSKVKGLEVQQQVAKNNLNRFSMLLQKGAVSQQAYDTVNSRFADLSADLRAAQEELEIAQAAVLSVQTGSFYNGRELIGDLPRLTTDVENWQGQVQLTSQKIAALEQTLQQQQQEIQALTAQKRNLQAPNSTSTGQKLSSVVYKAPFAGRVLKVMKSSGNTVHEREALVLLRHETEQPRIDAYLTQDQAAQVTMGSRATVLLPNQGKQYQAQVIEIDRTGGFNDEVRGTYQLSGSKDQSAYVRLTLVNVDSADRSQFAVGTPVVLKLTKKVNFLAALFKH